MWNRKMAVYGMMLTIAFVSQIIFTIFFYDPSDNALRINIGWGVLWLSAVFGWLPIITFRRKGKVKGRSYIHTTVLVDSGIYAIVRHPQYLAGILLNAGLVLITPHWLVVILGLIAAAMTILDTFNEEQQTIEKFGDAYREYMQKVPRLNFVLGIFRAIQRKSLNDRFQ
jgi:protein-S-isoprenylcysteine O-methyltransferase Ste14